MHADEAREALLADTGLRLIDFGEAVGRATPLMGFAGTPVTTPPEVFAGTPHHTPADIWAVGILAQWLITLEDPLGESTMAAWEATISSDPPKLPIFGDCSTAERALEPVAELARRCLALDAARRPSAHVVQLSCESIREGRTPY